MKYIDLADAIKRDHMRGPITGLDGETYTLKWLDDHPELTGRTITESEAEAAFDHWLSDDPAFNRTELLKRLGITVIPDPEPTNAEKLPGRTITESELIAAVDETNHEDMNEYQKARALLVHLGHTVPTPEPTNADKLESLLEGGDINAQWGLRGGGVMFARELAHALDEAGVRVVTESE